MIAVFSDQEIESGYDPATRICTYTLVRGTRRWTVKIPLATLDAFGGDRGKRRDYLANAIEGAMRGPPDPS